MSIWLRWETPWKTRNSKSHQPHQTSLFSVRHYETSVFDSLWFSLIVFYCRVCRVGGAFFSTPDMGELIGIKRASPESALASAKRQRFCVALILTKQFFDKAFSLTSRHHDPIITSHWSHLYQLLELLKSATFVPLYPFRREPLSHFDFPMEDQTKCRKNLTIWHLTKNGKKQTKLGNQNDPRSASR